jgi:hypothetical protein
MLTPSKGSSQEMIGTSKPDQWYDQSAQPINLTFFPSVFTLKFHDDCPFNAENEI